MLAWNMDLFVPSSPVAPHIPRDPKSASDLCRVILPLCFDNDTNCSPRNPRVLITIQNTLPYTSHPAKISIPTKAPIGRKPNSDLELPGGRELFLARRNWRLLFFQVGEVDFYGAFGAFGHQVGADEGVQVAIEDAVDVADFDAGAEVFGHAVGLQDVGADL